MSTECKTKHTRRYREGTRARRARASTTAWAGHAQAGAGHACKHNWQGTRKQGAGHASIKTLYRPTGLCCRTNSTGRHVQAHRGHAVEAPGQWYLACRCRCCLSASWSRPPQKYDPRRMVKNGPHERTGASGEKCFSKATWVQETVVRTHPVLLEAPLALHTPVLRGIAKTSLLCVVLCFINPRVRKIRNEASSCLGIFSRTLRFYYVASSLATGSPLFHLLDGHRKLVGSSAIPARSYPGPVRYHWRSIIELEVPPDETPGLMTLHPYTM